MFPQIIFLLERLFFSLTQPLRTFILINEYDCNFLYDNFSNKYIKLKLYRVRQIFGKIPLANFVVAN